jgi:hypothetical protein
MGTKKLTIVLPDELHGKLVSLAEREERSLHGQILYLLRESSKISLKKPANPWWKNVIEHEEFSEELDSVLLHYLLVRAMEKLRNTSTGDTFDLAISQAVADTLSLQNP